MSDRRSGSYRLLGLPLTQPRRGLRVIARVCAPATIEQDCCRDPCCLTPTFLRSPESRDRTAIGYPTPDDEGFSFTSAAYENVRKTQALRRFEPRTQSRCSAQFTTLPPNAHMGLSPCILPALPSGSAPAQSCREVGSTPMTHRQRCEAVSAQQPEMKRLPNAGFRLPRNRSHVFFSSRRKRVATRFANHTQGHRTLSTSGPCTFADPLGKQRLLLREAAPGRRIS